MIIISRKKKKKKKKKADIDRVVLDLSGASTCAGSKPLGISGKVIPHRCEVGHTVTDSRSSSGGAHLGVLSSRLFHWSDGLFGYRSTSTTVILSVKAIGKKVRDR